MDSYPTEKQVDEHQDSLEMPEIYENKRKRRCSSTPTSDELPQKKSTLLTTSTSKSPTPLSAEDEHNKQNLVAISHKNGDDDKLEMDDNPLYYMHDEFLLEEFCDEVLYEIFKFLDTWSLMTLMNVCKRFQKFVLDKRLWQNIDLSQEPLPLGILEDMLERSHDKTLSIKLRGPSPSQHIEGEIQHFNKTIRNSFATRCTKLVTLELYGVTLDFKQISIKEFPKPLKRLVLNNCNVRVDGNKALFTGIDTYLINLEELAIENNAWFDPFYVMPISKLPSLRYLSLKGCSQMQEFIPYGSIAARHGFKQLEVLDLRDAPLSDSDLQCFNAVETLKEIYLQSPEDDLDTQTSSTQDLTNNNNNASTSVDNSDTNLNNTTSSVSIQSNGEVLKANCRDTSAESPSTSRSALAKNDINDSNKTDEPSSTNTSFILNDNESTSSSSSSSSSTSSSSSSSSCSQWPYNNKSSGNSTTLTTTMTTATSPSTSSSTSSSSSSSSANGSGFSANVVPLVGSNTPPRSRFLPRPDHIIYLDVRNPTSPNAVHINIRDRNNIRNLRLLGQGPQQPQQPGANQQSPAFDQMIRHNLFWDIINPLGRVAGGAGPVRLFGEDNVGAEFGGALSASQLFSIASSSVRPQRGNISDRGVCCFGRTRQPVQQGVIWIRFNNRPSENRFERFSVRDYKFVTDVSLQHLVQCSPHLVFLDVSGTSVTLDGVQRFKDLKPECKVVAEHLLDDGTTTANSEITVS